MSSRANRNTVQDQLRDLIREAGEVVAGLDPDGFNRQPEPGSWSVGECLEHLNETARLYLPVLAESIQDARARGLLAEPGAGGRTLLGRVVTWMMEPPPRIKMKTFEVIQPDPDDLDPGEVLEAFEALHEELIVRANESADLNCKKIRIRSVLDRRLKLSLGDWYAFLAAHGRRHVWQARQARTALDAPPPDEPPNP
jgi:hypothetical protein